MLEAKKIEKEYGQTRALNSAELMMRPGEIMALLGANGSGKSTIAKVLGGLVSKDQGLIMLNGEEINIRSAKDSLEYGIALAYQDYSLVDDLTIEENLFLNIPVNRALGFIDFRKRKKLTEQILSEFQIEVNPETYVKDLDESFKSLLEVAKALNYRPKYLILDEVTACLHRDQVLLLFDMLRAEQKKGTSILFISHRLDEVFELCSSVTILRDGATVMMAEIQDLTVDDIVFYMTGERAQHNKTSTESFIPQNAEPIFYTKGLCIGNRAKEVSLKLYPGEIVGICGLQGQGQSEFLRAVFGYLKFDRGDYVFNGKKYARMTPREALKSGIGFISGDRKTEGIFPDRSIFENISIQKIVLKHVFSGIHYFEQVKEVKNVAERLHIILNNIGQTADSLSGGNQQKLLFARNLIIPLKVLLLDDPTKGVDINARNEIQAILLGLAKKGLGCVYYSSDYKELIQIADRIIVFYEGRTVGEFASDTPEIESRIAAQMLGTGGEVES